MTINKKELELKSSAVTLSDMEIFVYPRLLYALFLANIMSPEIWKWRESKWFKGYRKKSPRRRILRLKQYIMNNYVFNLDLDTWGLTDKKKELKRFKDRISPGDIRKSNALFGYEGDKYYFDIDIRTHFGLDKYNSDLIPYWKTETVEAMNAFKYKEEFSNGAGECVSLSMLYAAALFIVAGIPLEDIYLMATPLHSQNFIDTERPVLTNNRRIVTKNMWFNGTAISTKARRALENEKVTIVSHSSGFIHTLYPEYSIDPEAYKRFKSRLESFLKTKLTPRIFGNFLRSRKDLHPCIQLRWNINGHDCYIALEKLVDYEIKHPYLFTDETRPHLMDKIDTEEFHLSPIPGRIILNDLENLIKKTKPDLSNKKDISRFKDALEQECINSSKLIEGLKKFCRTKPNLPAISRKEHKKQKHISLHPEMSRNEIINSIEKLRKFNSSADLAFYAYRDFSKTNPEPFLYAAVKRNPVSLQALKSFSISEIEDKLKSLAPRSIYSHPARLAQPDEVWNFATGDGLEKAILLANILKNRHPKNEIAIETYNGSCILKSKNETWEFLSSKQIPQKKLIINF